MWTKEQARAYQTEWVRKDRAAHPEKYHAQEQARYQQKMAALRAEPGAYEAYLQRHRESNKRTRVNTSGKIKARAKTYYAANKSHINAKAAEWAKLNPDKRKQSSRKWHRANPEHNKIWHRLNKYGLTPEAFAELTRKHGAACALCQSTTRLSVDHDHATGQIRGLLCAGCNTAIGRLGDSITGLQRALRYLEAAEAIQEERYG